ncbi:uncharacterized protein [Oryza sativa Japonica Group]|uniref:uncharacterized protein n=1 Tax=Oryza sativa subsp. japonica TaxID=39947 RepID=UPI00077540EB|nr:uncharacterized protein LOC107279112 [Oryza sativa Japonica Group]
MVIGLPVWVIKAIDKKRRAFLWTGHPCWDGLKSPVKQTVSDMFAASTFFVPGNGESMLFWSDQWIDGRSVASLAPDLLFVVPQRLPGSRTVASGLANNSYVSDIRGALTIPVISQFLLIWDAVLHDLETANHILLDYVFAQ